MAICSRCKSECAEGSKFCPECGENLAGTPLASVGDHGTRMAEPGVPNAAASGADGPDVWSSEPNATPDSVFPEEAGDIGSLGDAPTFMAGADSASDLSAGDLAIDESRGDYEATMGDSPTMAGELGITAELAQRFEVIEELGRGGMGVVYKARDRLLGRLVALKRLTTEIQANQRAIDRFWTEAKTIASLTHHNCVRIYNLVQDELGMCIELEYVEGGDLQERIKRDGALPADEVRDIGTQLCEAVAEAHDKGIIHRDIKPANVLMTPGGMPKLSDFGLARPMEGTQTMTGALMGTMHFAAPEQLVSGKHVDERSDIYALGATLYALAVGEPPRTVRLERVPESLRGAIAQCLEENPDSRYQSARELREALASGRARAATSAAACPECGFENPIDVRFCQQCGQDLSSLFRKCPTCERENRVDVEFCGGCGTNVAQHFAIVELMEDAARLHEACDFEAAVGKCEEVLALDVEHESAKALASEARGKIERIAALTAEAVEMEGEGKLQEAVECYQEVLKLRPSEEAAVANIPRLHEAITKAERRERAERVAQLAGEVQAAQGVRDYAKAIEACKAFLELEPNHPGAKAHLPKLERRRILQLADEVRTAQAAGELRRAVAACRQILEIQPDNAETVAHMKRLQTQVIGPLANKMREAEQRGNWEEALRYCREVLEIAPDHEAAAKHAEELEVSAKLGQLQRRLTEAESIDDLDGAAGIREEILQLSPDDDDAKAQLAAANERRVKSLLGKAKTAEREGKLQEALWNCEKALEIVPESKEAESRREGLLRQAEMRDLRRNVAEAQASGDMTGALRILDDFIDSHPDDGSARTEVERLRVGLTREPFRFPNPLRVFPLMLSPLGTINRRTFILGHLVPGIIGGVSMEVMGMATGITNNPIEIVYVVPGFVFFFALIPLLLGLPFLLSVCAFVTYYALRAYLGDSDEDAWAFAFVVPMAGVIWVATCLTVKRLRHASVGLGWALVPIAGSAMAIGRKGSASAKQSEDTPES